MRSVVTAANKIEPTPGDVGRFALHMDSNRFATQLVQWCGDDVELNVVAAWMEDVASRLRQHRATL